MPEHVTLIREMLSKKQAATMPCSSLHLPYPKMQLIPN